MYFFHLTPPRRWRWNASEMQRRQTCIMISPRIPSLWTSCLSLSDRTRTRRHCNLQTPRLAPPFPGLGTTEMDNIQFNNKTGDILLIHYGECRHQKSMEYRLPFSFIRLLQFHSKPDTFLSNPNPKFVVSNPITTRVFPAPPKHMCPHSHHHYIIRSIHLHNTPKFFN